MANYLRRVSMILDLQNPCQVSFSTICICNPRTPLVGDGDGNPGPSHTAANTQKEGGRGRQTLGIVPASTLMPWNKCMHTYMHTHISMHAQTQIQKLAPQFGQWVWGGTGRPENKTNVKIERSLRPWDLVFTSCCLRVKQFQHSRQTLKSACRDGACRRDSSKKRSEASSCVYMGSERACSSVSPLRLP